MAFSFLIELESYPPKYISRKTTAKNEIQIFESLADESVFVGSHQDTIYKSKIEKCQELDCSQFYSSGFTSGAVSLCQDCEPFQPRGPGDGPSGGCPEYGALSAINFTAPSSLFVYNPPEGGYPSGVDPLGDYQTWVANTQNAAVASSGFWLGLRPCSGGNYQCLVSCATGNVAGCWNRQFGSDNFGNVYSIGGSSYQVYDPLQITLGGLTPNGGTHRFLNSNPISGLTLSGSSCDTITTKFPRGRGAINCLAKPNSGNIGGEQCSGGCPGPETNIGVDNFITGDEDVYVVGDYTNKVFSFSGGCGSTRESTTITSPFALGGGGGVPGKTSSLNNLGVSGVFSSCKDCLQSGADKEDSYVPSCCEVSCGIVTIEGAPKIEGYDAEGNPIWSSGSGAWDDWDDQGNPHRDNEDLWVSSCTPQIGDYANSTGSIPCVSTPVTANENCQSENSLSTTGVFIYFNCDNEVYGVLPKVTLEDCKDCQTQTEPVGVWEEYRYSPSGPGCNNCCLNENKEKTNALLLRAFQHAASRNQMALYAVASGQNTCPLFSGGLPNFGVLVGYKPGEAGYQPGECCAGNTFGIVYPENVPSVPPSIGDACTTFVYDPPRALP